MNTIECKNCKQEASGKFCSNCGQITKTHRIDLHHIFHEFTHGILHVDKGILFTAKELTLRPGKTIRDYLAGKRVSFFRPFAYFFILATIYVFANHFNKPALNKEEPLISISSDEKEKAIIHILSVDEVKTEEDSDQQDLKTRFLKTISLINKIFRDHLVIIWLCVIPIFSIITMLVFRKMKYNYGEHLVINAFIGGHFLLIKILSILLLSIVSCSIFDYLTIAFLLYMLASFFNEYGIIKRFFLTFNALLLTLIFISILVIAGIGLLTALQ